MGIIWKLFFVFPWFSDNTIIPITSCILNPFQMCLPIFCLGHYNTWLNKNKQMKGAQGDNLQKAGNILLQELDPDFVVKFITLKFRSGH